MPSRATNTDVISEASSSADKSGARRLHERYRRGDRRRTASPEQRPSSPDIQEKIKEFRREDILLITIVAPILLTAVAGFSVWFWIAIQRETLAEKQLAPPPNWDEAQYLSKNPDVAAAVRRGRFKSGWRHYLIRGVGEGRQGVSIE